jgi:hypothetical protein
VTGSEDVKMIVEIFVFLGALLGSVGNPFDRVWPPTTQGAHSLKCVCTWVWDINVCCIVREYVVGGRGQCKFVNASWSMRRNSGLEGLSYGVNNGNCASALNFDHNPGKKQQIFLEGVSPSIN